MIRVYRPTDHTQVKNLLKENWMYFEEIDNADVLKEKIEQLPWSILVYKEDDKLIWCCFVTHDPAVQLIYHLCVQAEYRNKWIWRMLVKEIEKLIRDMWYKCQRPAIFVEESNKEVLDFYKKLWYSLVKNMGYLMLERDLK